MKATDKLVIFDFDGTIADTLAAAIKVVSEMADEGRLQHFSKDDLVRWRSLKPQQVLKEAKIPLWKIPFLLNEGRQRLRAHAQDTILFEGMKDSLDTTTSLYRSVVISTNSSEFISTVLDKYEISGFEEIQGGGTLFGKHHKINKILKKFNIDPNNALLVTDEVRDLDSARKSKIHSIAVSWGFQEAQTLAACQPDGLATSPQAILPLIKSILK